MTIIKGYLKDSNNVYYPNVPLCLISRTTGAVLTETITGDGSSLSIDDPYYYNTFMLLRLNNEKSYNDLSFKKVVINNFGIVIDSNEGIEQDGAAAFTTNCYLRSNPITFSIVDLCLEAYVKLTEMPTSDNWPGSWSSCFSIGGVGSPNTADGFNLVLGATKIFLNNNNSMICAGNHGMVINTWYHIEVVRQGTTLTTRINGQDIASYAIANNALGIGSYFYIGCETVQGAYLKGYMNDFRVTLHNARHPNSFTPSFKHFAAKKTNIGGPIGYYELDVNYVGEADIVVKFPSSLGISNNLIRRVTVQ